MGKYSKSFHFRREELRQALYRIEGAIDRYKRSNEIAELGILAIELRGLLFGEALFISLSEGKSFPLELYTVPAMEMDTELRRGPTHDWSGDSVSVACGKPWTERVTVRQWLEMPIVEVKNTIFTPKRLINEIANSIGPAHYSPEMSNALLEMTQYSLGGVPSHFRTLLKFGECLLELGKRFLAAF